MGLNPSFSDSPMADAGNDLPVNNVSWLEAVSFCKALTILGRNTGNLTKNLEFRLPTEVEWEYLAAGTVSTYYFGDDQMNSTTMPGISKIVKNLYIPLG